MELQVFWHLKSPKCPQRKTSWHLPVTCLVWVVFFIECNLFLLILEWPKSTYFQQITTIKWLTKTNLSKFHGIHSISFLKIVLFYSYFRKRSDYQNDLKRPCETYQAWIRFAPSIFCGVSWWLRRNSSGRMWLGKENEMHYECRDKFTQAINFFDNVNIPLSFECRNDWRNVDGRRPKR